MEVKKGENGVDEVELRNLVGDSNKVRPMEVIKCENGVDQVKLRNPLGDSVKVSLHGGHVLSWQSEKGEKHLFTGGIFKALFKRPEVIEGGIPICFPHFGTCAEQNGFAKNKIWTIDENVPPPKDPEEKSFVDLLLTPSASDRMCWPHSYEFRLRVFLSKDGKLSLISRIKNIDKKPFSFTFAYHTYLAVHHISDVRIEGLQEVDYLDNLNNKKRHTEQGSITFDSEMDRIYLDSPRAVAVLDHFTKRTFVIRKKGLPDLVVWNPWERKTKSFLDFCSADYKEMVCVNAAAVINPITLKPGKEWKGSVELMLLDSSLSCEYDGIFSS